MKVALISYDFGEYCTRLAQGLSREALVLLLSARQETDPYRATLGGGVIYRPFCKPRLRQPAEQLATVAGILRWVRRFQPDVVHFQHWHLWFNLALPLLRRYPLVVTVHDVVHHVGDRESARTPSWLIRLGYRSADRLVVHNRKLIPTVSREAGFPEDRIHVIPHISFAGPPDREAEASWEPAILFFGRIWPYKGLEYLIQAEPSITERVPGATIIIAGRGEDVGRYREMMRHPERFELYNRFIPEAERAALLRRAAVVALPYVEASQSGVVPLAYAFSRPVVATRVGGLPETVDDGETGCLVPPRNPGALADAIVRLLRDPESARRMGARGKLKNET
ncbi:MAG TPA: glycosyltransferase family 4 protein, partial [Chloroflexota bacterium]|nr:glycosyltransferase family 4 protein [Chloroflexota bacterium]